MNAAKEWDAKKADIQRRWEELRVSLKTAEAELAALGPRPAERVVEWDGWTFTYDGELFSRNKSGIKVSGTMPCVLLTYMPPAKVIEVAALALPEGPVDFAAMREEMYGIVVGATACYVNEAERAVDKIIALLGTLYRTPQPQGVEVGRFDANGNVEFTNAWVKTPDNKLANHRLIAVPTPEAK